MMGAKRMRTSRQQLIEEPATLADRTANGAGADAEPARKLALGEVKTSGATDVRGLIKTYANAAFEQQGKDIPKYIWHLHFEEFAAAIRALSSPGHNADAGKLVEGDGWLPIESAPMDGTWFLAYRPEPDGGTWDRLCIVCWSAEEDDFVWPDDTFDIYRDDLSDMDDRGFLKFDTYSSCGSFTHWRPLPSAPSQEAAGS
nr:hypothetical protein [Brucella intermedia]